ncbi:MAG: hypothetical protein LH660_18750, partial [Phormidesmis sp. CAN_BIN36]|nr:hypothetical protein [Phormidesmis sp. CAN_BIN36]
MSSSGRFQSHLFNFVSRQAQKMADQTKKVARHLKVATIWGTQILLYPVYILFQSTRLVGQKLRQTVKRSVLRLRLSQVAPYLSSPPLSELFTVDTPIQRVLAAVEESWLLAGANSADLAELASNDSLAQSIAGSIITIQGIASLISTGKLVLVTIDNQVMDVLTIEQQNHLKQRIIWEMANYWRYWRRHYIAQAHPALLPPEDRATMLPPVRVFRQLMAWVQSGPIAIAANLFQESALVVPAPLDWFSSDLALAEFNPVGWMAGIPTTSDLAKLIQQLPSLGEMESLVWAAIRYFFGERSKNQLDTRIADQTTPIASAVPNSWLTSEEVFGNAGTLRAASPRSPLRGRSPAVQIEKTFKPLAHLSAQREPKILALPSQRVVTIGSLQNWVKRALPRSRPTLVHQKNSPRQLTRSTNSQPLTLPKDRVQGAPDRNSSQALQKSTRSILPDYIDTHATPI